MYVLARIFRLRVYRYLRTADEGCKGAVGRAVGDYILSHAMRFGYEQDEGRW